MRRELLNKGMFGSLNESRIICEEWRQKYNEDWPHKSLKYLSPDDYNSHWQQMVNNRFTALSKPVSEKLNQIEAQPVVDKAAANEKKITFENSN